MVRNDSSEAIGLFGQAADSELLLMKAVLLELAGRDAEAGKLLGEVQERRPEWFALWVARGMVLAGQKLTGEARHALETAVALGARSPEVHDLLAGKAGVDLKGSVGAGAARVVGEAKTDHERRWSVPRPAVASWSDNSARR